MNTFHVAAWVAFAIPFCPSSSARPTDTGAASPSPALDGRGFSPSDVPQLWCWAFCGHDLLDGSHVRFSTAGGNHIEFLRNLEGTASRDFHVNGWLGHHPGVAGLDTNSHLPLDVYADYRTEIPILSTDEGYGPSFVQAESFGAHGGWLVAWAMVNTRSRGTRYVFGQDELDRLRMDQEGGSGGIYLTVDGGPELRVSEALPHGPLLVVVQRKADDRILVWANGEDVTSEPPVVMSGVWDPMGFGGNGTPAWDDFLLEFLQCKGDVTEPHRLQLTEFLRERWQLYPAAAAPTANSHAPSVQ